MVLSIADNSNTHNSNLFARTEERFEKVLNFSHIDMSMCLAGSYFHNTSSLVFGHCLVKIMYLGGCELLGVFISWSRFLFSVLIKKFF